MIFISVAAIVGGGVVTGLLFAFANFVMQALATLDDEHGMRAMQQINEKIINPIFLAFFLGTPLLCVIIAIASLMDPERTGSMLLLSGAILYLIGPFGITMFFNVPLNNRLAEAEVSEASAVWVDYQVRWQRWNILRTLIGIFSLALLAAGLGGVGF